MSHQENLRTNESAEVGIGTMIVFIATILVAAVAAGIVIDTSQKLQAKSTETGNDATSNVGTGLTIVDLLGKRDAAGTTTLQQVDFVISLSPGSEAIDISRLVLHYNNGQTLTNYVYEAPANAPCGAIDGPASGFFWPTWVRGSSSANTMDPGEIVRIQIGDACDGAPVSTVAITTGSTIDINILTPSGSSTSIGFVSPTSFGAKTTVELN